MATLNTTVTTAGTFLMYKATPEAVTYTELCKITSYPDFGSAPSKIDITDLSDLEMKRNMLGLQEAPDLTFECNYNETDYAKIIALNGEYDFAVHFGTDGANGGKLTWKGGITAYINGGGVDEVRKMTVIISASTAIAKA